MELGDDAAPLESVIDPPGGDTTYGDDAAGQHASGTGPRDINTTYNSDGQI